MLCNSALPLHEGSNSNSCFMNTYTCTIICLFQAAIWQCLNHYAYQDAIFLAERLYAEGNLLSSPPPLPPNCNELFIWIHEKIHQIWCLKTLLMFNSFISATVLPSTLTYEYWKSSEKGLHVFQSFCFEWSKLCSCQHCHSQSSIHFLWFFFLLILQNVICDLTNCTKGILLWQQGYRQFFVCLFVCLFCYVAF